MLSLLSNKSFIFYFVLITQKSVTKEKLCLAFIETALYLLRGSSVPKSENCQHAGFPTNVISCGNVKVNSISQKTDHSALCLSDVSWSDHCSCQILASSRIPRLFSWRGAFRPRLQRRHNLRQVFAGLQHEGSRAHNVICDFNTTSGFLAKLN